MQSDATRPNIPPQQKPPQPLNTTPRTFGFAGIIFAFIIPPLGLILSIIGYTLSRRGGFKNSLAFAGIVVSTILVLLAAICFSMLYLMEEAFEKNQSDTNQAATAQRVQQDSEAYAEQYGSYPSSFSSLNESPYVAEASAVPLTIKPVKYQIIAFYYCESAGNKIEYWDYNKNKTFAVFTGTANAESTCTIAP